MAKYLIKFKSKPNNKDLRRLEKDDAKIKRKYDCVNAVAVEIDESKVGKLVEHPNVILVEADGEIHIVDELDNSWGVKQIGAGIMHEQGVLGTGVKVAVIDTGIDYTHPELSKIYRGGYDFVNNDSDPMDDHFHGTHCAGILAAARDGIGVVGVAPNIELYAIKILSATGVGYYSDAIIALDWCIKNGIQITSNSYSGGTYSATLEEAFQAAYNKGILSIAGAGNNGGNEKFDETGYPARFASVVAVAATDKNKQRPYFSSTGPATEVAAPGVDIQSCVLAGKYATYSGTSMACPHVAGVAALVKSAHPEWNHETIRGQIRATAEDLGSIGHDYLYGFGLVDAVKACGDLLPAPPMPPLPPPRTPAVIKTLEATGPITHTLTMVIIGSGMTSPPAGKSVHGNIIHDSAILNGELVSLGNAPGVNVNFRIYTPGSSMQTPMIYLTKPAKYSQLKDGLTPNMEYKWFAGALTEHGVYSFGEIKAFTTASEPSEVIIVKISAYPYSGWQFDNWIGDVADPNLANTTIIMDSDKTVTACFSKIPLKNMVVSYFNAIQLDKRQVQVTTTVSEKENGLPISGVNVIVTGVKLDKPATGKEVRLSSVTGTNGRSVALSTPLQDGKWEFRPSGIIKEGYIGEIPADKVKVLTITK